MVTTGCRNTVSQLIKDENISETIEFEHFWMKFSERLSEFSDELKYFENRPQSFQDFLREQRIGSELGVHEMYQEILHLSGVYAKKNEVFRISNEIGKFSLPDRSMILIKIKWLYEELLFKIIPEIENNLNFHQESYDEQSAMIKGSVDWNSTILSSVKRGEQFPLQFDCKMYEVNFETSENLLAAFCIIKLETDVRRILVSIKSEDLIRDKDFDILRNVRQQSHLIKTRSHLDELIRKMEKYSHLSMDSRTVKNLEEKTKFRIRTNQITQRSYSNLLKWVEEYRGYNLPSSGSMLADFPFENKISIDHLYQFWVYFRMIDYFVTHEKMRILETLRNEKDFFRGFSVECKSKRFELCYEYYEHGWTGIKSNPDIVVKQKGKLSIIMDPKNWKSEHGPAYHKMMGYLYNFIKKEASVGILFFSFAGTYEQDSTENIKTIVERKTIIDGKPVNLISYVLHPKNTSFFDAEKIFKHLFSIIEEKIN